MKGHTSEGPTSLTLTHEELVELTGYRRASRQLRALIEAGIRAWRRADGSVVVLRSQLVVVSTREQAAVAAAHPRLHLQRTGLKR